MAAGVHPVPVLRLQQLLAEHLPETAPDRMASADDDLRCSVLRGHADRHRSGPLVHRGRDVVVRACTDRAEEEHTADGTGSAHTGRTIEGELRSHSADSMDVGARRADIPDSRSGTAFLDEVAYAVACDDLVVVEAVPDDGAQLRSEVERAIRRCVEDSVDRAPKGQTSAPVEHGDVEVEA